MAKRTNIFKVFGKDNGDDNSALKDRAFQQALQHKAASENPQLNDVEFDPKTGKTKAVKKTTAPAPKIKRPK